MRTSIITAIISVLTVLGIGLSAGNNYIWETKGDGIKTRSQMDEMITMQTEMRNDIKILLQRNK